jgi:hypothetical protein
MWGQTSSFYRTDSLWVVEGNMKYETVFPKWSLEIIIHSWTNKMDFTIQKGILLDTLYGVITPNGIKQIDSGKIYTVYGWDYRERILTDSPRYVLQYLKSLGLSFIIIFDSKHPKRQQILYITPKNKLNGISEE